MKTLIIILTVILSFTFAIKHQNQKAEAFAKEHLIQCENRILDPLDHYMYAEDVPYGEPMEVLLFGNNKDLTEVVNNCKWIKR